MDISSTYFGFTDNMKPMQKTRVEKTLDKKIRLEDRIITNKEFVYIRLTEQNALPAIEENYTYYSSRTGEMTKPRTLYKLEWKQINHLGNEDTLYNEVTKTEHDYAQYLITNDFINRSKALAFITTEQERIKAEEQAEAMRQAKERKQREDEQLADELFAQWLEKESEQYQESEKLALAQEIFMADHGFHNSRIIQLLVLIDNIEIPACRNKLKEWLHYGNATSKKVFYHITGIRLPRTDKETMGILDTITTKNYDSELIPFINPKDYNSTTAKQHPKNNEQKFYRMLVGQGFTEAYGKLFEIEGLRLYGIMLNDQYTLIEERSGMKLVHGRNQTEARRAAHEIINKHGIDNVRVKIDQAIKRFGASPLQTT